MMAKGQGFQRRVVEERVKRVMDTLVIVFKFEKVWRINPMLYFLITTRRRINYGRACLKANAPTEADREISAERDERLKKVLSEEQFKTFKEEIEPALRPKRRQG